MLSARQIPPMPYRATLTYKPSGHLNQFGEWVEGTAHDVTIQHSVVNLDAEVVAGPTYASVNIETEMRILTRYRAVCVNSNTYAGWTVTLSNGVVMAIGGIAEAIEYGRKRMMYIDIGVVR